MQKLDSAPAFKIAFFFLTGIVAGSYFKISITLLIVLIVIQILFLLYLLRVFSSAISVLSVTALLLFSLGLMKAQIDFHLIPGNSISKIPDTKRNEETKLIGVIQDIPSLDSNKIRFSLSSEFLIKQNDTVEVSGDVIVTIKRNNKTDFNEFIAERYDMSFNYDFRPDLKPGDRVLIYGKLSEPFEERNP